MRQPERSRLFSDSLLSLTQIKLRPKSPAKSKAASLLSEKQFKDKLRAYGSFR
jgi:hypothetical protein